MDELEYNINGKIKSIYCQNFVTYEKCLFFPTDYLNVIIGPNGTGKSTIVSAIVLGLGGEPVILSRDSSLQSYIKNGSNKAIIKIVLQETGDKTITFQRSFDRSGKSEFKVNESKLSKSKFLETVSLYNIEISNLCQFLPQDRVQDFAKMNPQEIFNNTLSSICDTTTMDEFLKLKELRCTQLQEERNCINFDQKFKELTSEINELSQILHSYDLLMEYRDKLEACKFKKLSLEVDNLSIKIKKEESNIQIYKRFVKEEEVTYKNIQNKYEKVCQNIKSLKEDAKKKEILESNSQKKNTTIIRLLNEHIKEIDEVKLKLQEEKKDIYSQIHNEKILKEGFIQDLCDATSQMNCDFDNLNKNLQISDQQVKKLKEKYIDLKEMHSKVKKTLDEDVTSRIMKLDKDIELATNVGEQKLKIITNKYPDEHLALCWIEENRQLFKGHVYKPIVLELQVCDTKYAKYFENTISDKDIRAFGCENKSDLSTLRDELILKKQLRINVLHVPPAEKCEYTPQIPIAKLKFLGFSSYLLDLAEAAPAILNYLCSIYNLHGIPIGTEDVSKFTDNIPKSIRQYYGGDEKYVISISSYSGESSLSKSGIKSKDLLSTVVNVDEVKVLKTKRIKLLEDRDKLRNNRSEIEKKINDIEFQRNKLIIKKRETELKIQKIKQLHDKIQKQENKISELKKKENALSETKKENFDNIVKNLKSVLELHNKKIENLGTYHKNMRERVLNLTKTRMFEQQNQGLINIFKEAENTWTKTKGNLEVMETNLSKSKRVKQSKQDELNSSVFRKVKSRLKYIYDALPTNLDEIEENINKYNARIECMNEIDVQIVEKHEKKKHELEALHLSILENTTKKKKIEGEIHLIFEDWFKKICDFIIKLNEKFSNFMQSMNYVGGVFLIKKDRFDFDSYGIDIKVKYRKNIALQSLDRTVQSGGERSVAIAVYTLSLQHITYMPFCCVDEINQGMDARNERKILEMLINETTKTGRPQYFFVTPKLLPDLNFNERVSVHVVFNGKMVQSENAFSFTL